MLDKSVEVNLKLSLLSYQSFLLLVPLPNFVLNLSQYLVYLMYTVFEWVISLSKGHNFLADN